VNFHETSSKNTHTKFHENPSSGSQLVLCRRTGRQTDMTKLIVAYRNFATAPHNQSVHPIQGNDRCLFSDPHKTHK